MRRGPPPPVPRGSDVDAEDARVADPGVASLARGALGDLGGSALQTVIHRDGDRLDTRMPRLVRGGRGERERVGPARQGDEDARAGIGERRERFTNSSPNGGDDGIQHASQSND